MLTAKKASEAIKLEDVFVQYPIIGGIYDHYKGGIYEVIAVATHSETQEVLVVYKSLVFGTTHVRPLNLWFESIVIKELRTVKEVQRFKFRKMKNELY